MSSKIILVRHGRSAHVHTGWIDAAGLRRWNEAYDDAGIMPGEAPPATLREVALRAGVVVSSDLPRARASAALLAPVGEVTASPLLREADLGLPSAARVRLPLAGWGLVIALRGAYRMLRSRDPRADELRRAHEAAAWLAALAGEHGTVVAVTHGYFRRLVAGSLCDGGWSAGPGRRSIRHWSAWAFTRDG